MKKLGVIFGLTGIAFGVTLAAFIGARLSEEALSVVMGAACGAGALLPMLAMLFGVLVRRTDSASRPAPASAPYPPVIVVSPQPSALPAGQNWLTSPHAQPAAYHAGGYPAGNLVRQFSIIGADGEEMIENGYHTAR